MRLRRRLLAPVLIVGLTTGCGPPTSGPAVTVAPEQVPTSLISPRPQATSPAVISEVAVDLRVFFLDLEGRLRAHPAPVEPGTVEARARALLAILLNGPADAERARGLTTGLSPRVGVVRSGVESGIATLSWDASAFDPTPRTLPMAIGQIVLTLTSIPGVHAVAFTRNGSPVDVPLPSGELASGPINAGSYRDVQATAPPPTP